MTDRTTRARRITWRALCAAIFAALFFGIRPFLAIGQPPWHPGMPYDHDLDQAIFFIQALFGAALLWRVWKLLEAI